MSSNESTLASYATLIYQNENDPLNPPQNVLATQTSEDSRNYRSAPCWMNSQLREQPFMHVGGASVNHAAPWNQTMLSFDHGLCGNGQDVLPHTNAPARLWSPMPSLPEDFSVPTSTLVGSEGPSADNVPDETSTLPAHLFDSTTLCGSSISNDFDKAATLEDLDKIAFASFDKLTLEHGAMIQSMVSKHLVNNR